MHFLGLYNILVLINIANYFLNDFPNLHLIGPVITLILMVGANHRESCTSKMLIFHLSICTNN